MRPISAKGRSRSTGREPARWPPERLSDRGRHQRDTGCMATTFTRMDESTAEQWAVIGKETFEHQGRVAERALAMLRSLEEITDGFAVDQLVHSLQTATRAERDGADEEVVFASLFHDVEIGRAHV